MDVTPSAPAKTLAWVSLSPPVGSGRQLVRSMPASMRWSSSWLMVAAEAAARPMPRLPRISASKGGQPGAASSVPTTDVSTISATTLGLVSDRYSRQRGRAVPLAVRVGVSLVATGHSLPGSGEAKVRREG